MHFWSAVALPVYIFCGLLIYLVTYFIPDNVGNFLQKIFPTTVDVQFNKLTTRIRESLTTVSEFECGAHAHLAVGPIDYFLYLSDTGICYLGDFSVSPHASVDENNLSKYTIRILRGIKFTKIIILLEFFVPNL